MAYVPNSGSVVAFQSNPSSLLTGASIIGLTPVSVSNFPASSGSVVSFMGGPWSVSIIGSLTPPANQSVSGSVSVSNFPANQSVSGNVGVIGNPSISGTVLIGNAPSIYGNIGGSVVSFQGGAWSTTVTGTPAVSVQGTVFVSGSVITVGSAAPANQSVSGTVGASIIGSVPITGNIGITGTPAVSVQGTVFVSGSVVTVGSSAPANQSVSGTVVTISQGSIAAVIIGGSIAASFTPPANQSVSGTVNISGNPSISGTVLATQNTTPWVISSVYGNISGSVVSFQGTNPWLETFSNSSIIGINAGSVVTISQGSVITILQSSSLLSSQQGIWRVSVAGTYATGAASVISGLGILGLGVRNDSLASVFGTNGQYTPFTIGPVGEMVVAHAPIPQWTKGVASLFTGVEQPVITSVLGSRINVTGLQIANASANNVYISLYGSGIGSVTGSIIGFTVAPANGGSNIVYPIPLQTAINSGFSASVSGVASVFLSAQGFLSSI